MHRYLPGIVLVQLVTGVLLWVNRAADAERLLLQVGLPAALIAAVTALWFASIGKADAERHAARLRTEHARDREKLQQAAERERVKLIHQAHKDQTKNERRVSRRANAKVGLAFMGATGAGVIMLITELLTLGLLTITTAGGAMGGYLLRARQHRKLPDQPVITRDDSPARVINADIKKSEPDKTIQRASEPS